MQWGGEKYMLEKFLKLQIKNKFLLCNILVCLALVYLIFKFQQYFCICDEGYSINPIFLEIGYGRIVSNIFINIYEYIQNLSLSAQDFEFGWGAVIKTVAFSLIPLALSFSFCVNFVEKNIFKNTEGLIIIPLSFILTAIPIFNMHDYNIYLGSIRDIVIFFEYYIPLFFYFTFFIFCIYIQNKNNLSLINKITIIITAFFLGLWHELFSFATFISIFIYLIISAIRKTLSKNVNVYCFFPFFLGFIIFCFLSDYISLNQAANYSYTIEDLINPIIKELGTYTKAYLFVMFKSKILLYIIIFSCSIILLSKKEKQINNILLYCFSILIGYLILNYGFIIFADIVTPEKYKVDYLFQRDLYDMIYVNILEFIIMILIGSLYSVLNIRILKKIIITVLTILSILIIFNAKNDIKELQNYKKNMRLLAYKIEKINLLYNYFGETTILPISFLETQDYIKENQIFPFDSTFHYKTKNDYVTFMKDKYFDSLYVQYSIYFKNVYNKNFIGVIFKNDDIANIELNKRLNLLNEKFESDKEILKNRIYFRNLAKFKNKQISLNDINTFKIDDNNKDLIIKIKAYVNYRDGNFAEAEKFYNEYLEINPNDFDALKNMANIYFRQNKMEKAEKLYKKIHNIDNNNLTFMYKLLLLYYYHKKDYEKALEMCNKMIKTEDDMTILYLNKIIILYMMGKKDKYNKILEFVENESPQVIDEILYEAIPHLKDHNHKQNKKPDLINPSFIFENE